MKINGYSVNRHEVTVSEWYALIDQIKKQNANNADKRAKR